MFHSIRIKNIIKALCIQFDFLSKSAKLFQKFPVIISAFVYLIQFFLTVHGLTSGSALGSGFILRSVGKDSLPFFLCSPAAGGLTGILQPDRMVVKTIFQMLIHPIIVSCLFLTFETGNFSLSDCFINQSFYKSIAFSVPFTHIFIRFQEDMKIQAVQQHM